MKAARVLLLIAGALTLLLLIALGIALNASFQTWAARRVLVSQPNLRADLGRLSAGFRHVEIRALRIESHGAVLTVPILEMEVPLISAGVRKRVSIEHLVSKGWKLDLSKATDIAAIVDEAAAWSGARTTAASPREDFSLLTSARAADPVAASAAPPSVFRGIFAQLQLPVDFSLAALDLEGEVILPAVDGHEPAALKIVLHGGGLAAGGEGSFVLDANGANPAGGAMALHGTLLARMDSPRSFAKLGVKANASASGGVLADGVKLDLDADAVRTPAGESYTLLIASAGKQLASVKAELASATARITGTWKMDLRDSDVAPFALGRPWPKFTAAGEGGFETGAAFGELHATGQLNASVDHLDLIRPELSAVGAISLTADFDVLQHGNSLRVERFNAAISGTAPVASIQALQPFEFNLRSAELRVADPAQDLVSVLLAGVPVSWARPFLGDFAVSGGDMRGEFAASARNGGLALRVKSPLTLTSVSLQKKDQPLLHEIDLSLNASADYTPQGWQVEIVDFGLRSRGVTLLSLDAKAGQLAASGRAIKATGHWSANLPGWLGQPIIAGKLHLAAGLAQGEFNADLDHTKAIETKFSFSDLVAPTREKFPAITLELRADVASDGKIAFKIPVAFEQAGHKSDLLATGTLTPGTPVATLDARLTSEAIVAQDLQGLALLIPEEPAPVSSAAALVPIADTVPFWSSVTGQIAVAFKKITYADSFEVTGLNGVLRLDSTTLNLENVRAALGAESELKLAGGMKFDANAKQPYTLTADVAVNNFDTGAAFRALDPAKLPTVEAHVNLNGHIAGDGANVGQVADHARGDVQVTGKSGIFRALSADLSDKVQKTQSTVAAIGGLLGAVTGKEKYADYANKTQIFSDIAKALAEIPFDQLSVTAVRQADLDVVLKDFTLISPEVRLTGGGRIHHVEGAPLLAQPLDLELNLGARGKLADLLKRAKLLEETQDNLGYASFITPIKIGGTLAKTDASQLRDAILGSALEKSGILDRVLGK